MIPTSAEIIINQQVIQEVVSQTGVTATVLATEFNKATTTITNIPTDWWSTLTHLITNLFI